MKRPKAERYNNHVIYLAMRFLSFPFVLAAAAYRGAAGLRERLKSPDTRRAEDRHRQTRARRNLRGLPGDHVQLPAEPGAASKT